MARFFFDLHECGSVVPDHNGEELVSLQSARDSALRSARSIMAAEVTEGRVCLSCHIVIRDAADVEVGRLNFRDALTVTGL